MNDQITLDAPQLRMLSAMVADLTDRIGNPGVTPPTAELFEATPFSYAYTIQTLKVDIDTGGFVLPLCACAFETHTDGNADLARLAGAIAARIAAASRGRGVIDERLEKARQAAEHAAARIGARVLEVRLARQPTEQRLAARDRCLEVDIEILDDALRPTVETLLGYTPREFRGAIAGRGQQQRKRHARRSGLRADDLVEVSAVAEAAILFAGRRVGPVVADLLAAETCGQWTQLSGTHWKDHVSVRLLDGLLVCSAMIPGVGYIDTMELWINGVLPETVQNALRGKRLDRIADHPILRCDARLGQSRITDGNRTDFKFKAARRTVTGKEAWPQALAAAA